MSDTYGGRGLLVVTVSVDPDPEATVRLFRERGQRLPVTPDPDGTLQQRLGVFGHPSFVFLDRGGEVVGVAIGPREWLSPAGRAFLDALTAEGGK